MQPISSQWSQQAPHSVFIQPVKKPFSQTCSADQLLSFYTSRKNAKSTNVNRKIRKKWIEISTSCKNSQELSEGQPISKNHDKVLTSKSDWAEIFRIFYKPTRDSWFSYQVRLFIKDLKVKIQQFVSIVYSVFMNRYYKTIALIFREIGPRNEFVPLVQTGMIINPENDNFVFLDQSTYFCLLSRTLENFWIVSIVSFKNRVRNCRREKDNFLLWRFQVFP